MTAAVGINRNILFKKLNECKAAVDGSTPEAPIRGKKGFAGRAVIVTIFVSKEKQDATLT